MKFHLATIYHNYYSNLLFKNITEKLNKAHLKFYFITVNSNGNCIL